MNADIQKTILRLALIFPLVLLVGCSPSDGTPAEIQATDEPLPTRATTHTPAFTPTAEELQPEVPCDLALPGESGWPVQLCELFEDNRNDWQVESQDNPYARYTAEIADGQLQIDYYAKIFDAFQRSAVTWFDVAQASDFALSVSGSIDSRLVNCGWGVAFRADEDMTSYYLFSINNDSTFSLEFNNNNKNWIPLIPRTGHSSIRYAQPNTVTIIADGQDFTFLINDQQVGTFEGVVTNNSAIRLMVSAGEGADAFFAIDDVVLQTPALP